MTDTTARFALPLLQPGQAQKEMFHNAAIAGLDLVAQPGVVAAGVDTPPIALEVGQCWIVGSAPTGDWDGQANTLAGWGADGWRFGAPFEGMAEWVIGDALVARFRDGGWAIGTETATVLKLDGDQVVGARQPAIAEPSGGATIAAESRATLASILAALRTHGLIGT